MDVIRLFVLGSTIKNNSNIHVSERCELDEEEENDSLIQLSIVFTIQIGKCSRHNQFSLSHPLSHTCYNASTKHLIVKEGWNIDLYETICMHVDGHLKEYMYTGAIHIEKVILKQYMHTVAIHIEKGHLKIIHVCWSHTYRKRSF